MEMWKTAALPMENRYSRPAGKAARFPTARKHRFPQPANTVSHSSAPLAVYTHSHSAYYNYKSLLSYPNLIERDKRNKKEARASPSV